MADEQNMPDGENPEVNEPTDEAQSPGDSEAADPSAEAALAAAQAAIKGLSEVAEVDGDSDGNEEEKSDADAAAEAAMMNMMEGQGGGEETQDVEFPEFAAPSNGSGTFGIELLSQVNLHVRIELGRTKMLVEDVLRLNEGTVVELDKLAGDPVDVYVNDRLVARGEVLVLNDTFCVRVSEIVSNTMGYEQSAN